jgi:glycosyl hydrolase family 20
MKGFRISRKGALSLLNILLAIFLVVVSASRPAADASRQSTGKDTPSLRLLVDKERHARAFCGGLPAIVGICGFFEFYEHSLMGKRARICSGPWNGALRKSSAEGYLLSGRDPKSGAEYSIDYRQVDSSKFEVMLSFKGPSQSAGLGFDIVKLSGDLFKGSALESGPQAINDAEGIPMTPLPVAKRILLTNKNRVLVKGALCDLEITDLSGARSILVADCRAVPWDKEKSIVFCSEKSNLVPGRQYSFKYSIRCLPASRATALQNAKVTGTVIAEENWGSFFTTPAKDEKVAPGYYRLLSGDLIFGDRNGTAETILARKLSRLTSRQSSVQAPVMGKAGRGIRFELLPPGKSGVLPAEGYELVIGRDGVVIRGADARGCLYGAYAFLNRLNYIKGEWRTGCGIIRDWPDLPQRGMCIEMLPPAVPDVTLFKRYLEAISRAGGNLVVFLHDAAQVGRWRENAPNAGWTRKQMVEISEYARFLHLDVWAGMGTGFKAADFPTLAMDKESNFYDPFDEGSYRLIFSLYDLLINTYKPTTFLISHDEIRGLSAYAARMKVREEDIFAGDVARVRDWLAGRGIGTAIWGDMLLDHGRWESEVGAANSRNPFFNSGATHEAIKKLPRDILVLDWHYDPKKEFRSIDYFRKNGLRVMGATWYDPRAAEALAASVKRFDGEGILGTDWGFWRTLSPSAATLSAVQCGWSRECGTLRNNDVEALAGMLRGPAVPTGGRQVTLDLQDTVNRSTWDAAPGSGRGVFDAGPVLDLRALSSGRREYSGVLFDVAPAGNGKRSNCIVVSNATGAGRAAERESRVVVGDKPAKAIAFLHTCFVPEPQVAPRKLGEYVIEYQSGRKVSVDLQENWNITDVRSSEALRANPWTFARSPDVLVGSRPGWRGDSAAGIPLNMQVFVWHNPRPDEKIRSIRMRVVDQQNNYRIALLGVTLLQAGERRVQ